MTDDAKWCTHPDLDGDLDVVRVLRDGSGQDRPATVRMLGLVDGLITASSIPQRHIDDSEVSAW
ncbi:hypothetical protein [Micromonospora sp. NPDC005367]|uniref:hypothetical protein n=1 Tax=Micromonospora sp. NPDC005367 TaxID=3155590 RepID=UPI0033B82476